MRSVCAETMLNDNLQHDDVHLGRVALQGASVSASTGLYGG
jgi:hypothetical protein